MMQRPLNVYEKKFLLCSERGDVITVKRLLEEHKNNAKLDVNCVDPLGRSALVLAIENENMELIETLLKHSSIKPGDALLHAINEEYVEAVEVLLLFEETVHKPGTPYSWESIDHNVSIHTKDITPLILAAHKDNYEILKILLDRGATLPLPHDVKCGCNECITAKNEDCLKYSRSRINAYRALCSPSLIALSSRDPILTAFQLSWELRRLSKVEMEFAVEYRELRAKVQHFAVSLLDHVRTTPELQICLNYNPNQRYNNTLTEEEPLRLDRLKLAIDYKQKQFVAHPNVQQMLGTVWFQGMPGFRRKNQIGQALEVFNIAVRFPIHSLTNVLMPNTKIGKKLRHPFIKFISHSASYVFFLFLLVLASQRVESIFVHHFQIDRWSHWMHNAHVKERGKWPSLNECFIIVYVFGFIWQETCELIEGGLCDYVSNMWNIVDFTTNCVYVNWMALRFYSMLEVHLQELKGESVVKLREDWDTYDPLLLSEGMFGAANIFSFLKLVHIFSVHPHLGPLQISLGRMVFDILKFFFLFILVLFAFGCGMNQLLWYYANKDFQKCFKSHSSDIHHALDQDHSCSIWRRFSNLFETSQTLFWASFGLIDLLNFEMTGIKQFTRFWGLLMFGSYSVINVVVLLNLLIAMMSNSYQVISGRSDVEWKFARSKLWISYFDDSSSVPPPFNLIPSFGKCCLSMKKKLKSGFHQSFSGSVNKKSYENVMRCLVMRYITREQRKAEETGPVTEDDVNEIKQDIATFKYELLDILFSNGMRSNNKKHSDKDYAGKKERIRERRLLKGFNIGIVEKVHDSSENEDVSKNEQGSGIFRMIARTASLKKKNLVQKRWTSAVTAVIKQNGCQIGRTIVPEQRKSLVDLREKILSENESNELQKIEEENKTDCATLNGNDVGCSTAKTLVYESLSHKRTGSDKNLVKETESNEKTSSDCIDAKKTEERTKCNQTVVSFGDNWF